MAPRQYMTLTENLSGPTLLYIGMHSPVLSETKAVSIFLWSVKHQTSLAAMISWCRTYLTLALKVEFGLTDLAKTMKSNITDASAPPPAS